MKPAPPTPRPPLQIAIVAVPPATASTVYGLHDFFCGVGRDWELLTGETTGAVPVECRIVAARREPFETPNGSWIQPTACFDDAPLPDLALVGDLMVAPGTALGEDCAPAAEWLVRCDEADAVVASACSGALLLAAAGLLDGREAATHWAYCDALAQAVPTARIHPERVLVASGEGQRLITAGGGFSWHDLALVLVARFFGEEEAMRQARLHLIDWHADGQLPYAMLARTRQVDDPAIAECQAWLADHFRESAPITRLTSQSTLPERSLKRRFRAATGMTPLEYVHTLRLEEAKSLLEGTARSIEQIAFDVGYEDARFFRRLFRRRVGLTALAYRRRFGSVRRALRESAPARPR